MTTQLTVFRRKTMLPMIRFPPLRDRVTIVRPTVFLVDNDPVVRDSLSLSLKTAGLAVETYSSAQAFLAAYRPERPGCLVLDVRMPGMNGLELQEILAVQRSRIPIIFITAHGDISMSVKAIKAGAVDFLEKPFRTPVLLERIQEAIAQDARIRQDEVNRAAMLARCASLTPRERQVMALVVAGKSNKAIARQLKVSHRTVEIHRARVIKKMAAHSLSDLVAMAVLCGICEWSCLAGPDFQGQQRALS